jgi:hypothetical protein
MRGELDDAGPSGRAERSELRPVDEELGQEAELEERVVELLLVADDGGRVADDFFAEASSARRRPQGVDPMLSKWSCAGDRDEA